MSSMWIFVTILLFSGVVVQPAPAGERDDVCNMLEGAGCTPNPPYENDDDDDDDLSSLIQSGAFVTSPIKEAALDQAAAPAASAPPAVSKPVAVKDVEPAAAPKRSTVSVAAVQIQQAAPHLKPLMLLAYHSTEVVGYFLSSETQGSTVTIIIAIVGVLVFIPGIWMLFFSPQPAFGSKPSDHGHTSWNDMREGGQRGMKPIPEHSGDSGYPSMGELQQGVAPHWPALQSVPAGVFSDPKNPRQLQPRQQSNESNEHRSSPAPIHTIPRNQKIVAMYSVYGGGSAGEQLLQAQQPHGMLQAQQPHLSPMPMPTGPRKMQASSQGSQGSTPRTPRKHTIESRFAVSLAHLAKAGPQFPVDVLTVAGLPLLKLIIQGDRMDIASAQDGSVQWSVRAPAGQGGTFSIFGPQGHPEGTMKTVASGTTEVHFGGQLTMTAEGEASDLEYLLWSPGGKPVAISKVNKDHPKGDHFEIRALPGNDALLIVAVLLALLVFSSGSGR